LRARRPPARLRLIAESDEPLLAFLVRRGGISEELARAAIERGGAFVRAARQRDPAAPVRRGDRVEVSLQAPRLPPLTRAHILHLDDLVLAVDKPAGIAAQEDLAGGPALPELCGALLREVGERETQALLVHRLDRGTTGVTVLARTRRAQTALLAEFRERRARKEYRALVAPAPAADEGVLDEPIESRPARTRWQVLQRFPAGAAVAAFPETGRTHQIRLHLQALGSPLLGDRLHGGQTMLTAAGGERQELPRPMLHALSLELRHPRGGALRVLAPPPDDFEAARAFLAR
jgi:RluA family pseudouridine synthase